jgi:hypothetical protein
MAAPYASNVAIFPDPPFLQHLREIASGGKKLPDTQARKHHYVPSFLLARWATPQARDGRLFSLAVASGKVTQQKPGKVALEKDLYTLDGDAKTVDLAIEAFLSVIEGHAADPIKPASHRRTRRRRDGPDRSPRGKNGWPRSLRGGVHRHEQANQRKEAA